MKDVKAGRPLGPVIVTGAASGIGLACAQQLAGSARAVAVWDLDEGQSEKIADEISTRYGVAAIGVGVDVSRLDMIAMAVDKSQQALGAMAGLVHAAGVSGVSPLAQLTPEFWTQVLDVNLRALVFIVQAIRDDLKTSEGAAVVGISSINATLGNAMNPAYSASKGGMLSVTRALADDLANDGIRINSVSPGQIRTPMLQQALDHNPALEDEFNRRILMNRLGTAEEVAQAVCFLLSAEASYITASELVVDGGNISSQR